MASCQYDLVEETPAVKVKQSGLASVKLAVPGMLLALACLLPFLNKAFTIDDPSFLTEAQQIIRNPLQPWSYEFCWGPGNETCAKSGGKVNFTPVLNQALMGYVLVPAIALGGAEWIAHLVQALLACLAVFEMVLLVLRLGGDRWQAAAGGLLLVAIPPFLPMAATAMPDILAMTLGLTGIERLLIWKEERRWHQAALASLALGLAPFARPHLLLLLPIGALWLCHEFDIRKVLEQVRREAYLWLPVILAACLLIALELVTRERNVASAADVPKRFVDLGMTPRNLYAFFLYFSFPIPFAAVWLGTHWRKALPLMAMAAVPVLMLHFVLHPSTSLAREWATAAVLFGLAALAHLFFEYRRQRDWTGILLGLWMLLPLPVVVYQHLPIKYMLASLPAIVLVLVRTLAGLARSRSVAVYGVLIAGYTAYSCVILTADADFAENGRRAAAELIAPHVKAGENVWYGGQWGFFWYAQKAGAKVARPDVRGPGPGDLLAVGLSEGGDTTLARFPNRDLVDLRSYDSPHGRTMGAGAGLYSNYYGDALWVWEPRAIATYELWRIR